ncbi:glyoxalase family protein [Yersinia enterocolitica]|nr:glyoxalase family protein [Yersinia enterocolitica]
MGIQGNDSRIDNIEFAVSDIARSKDFYGTVFDWRFTDYGPSYCEFTDGRLTGGFTLGEVNLKRSRRSAQTADKHRRLDIVR